MAAFRKLGVIAKTDARAVAQTLDAVLAHLAQRGAEVQVDSNTAALAPSAQALPAEELASSIDLAVVIGGDGTLLHASHRMAPHGVPLLGINLGRLGFMVDVLPAELQSALDRVLDGEFILEKRLILEARSGAEKPCLAVNDVVVRHREYVRMLDFSTSADGGLISHHRADGIIVATPTGSTAYALSAGGPMLHPQLDAMALVPISPHTLSDRPLILNADSTIEIRPAGNGEDAAALYTCDGQVTHQIAPGETVSIQRSEHQLRLVHPPDYDYFSILRNKLHWGRGEQASPRGR